MSVSEGMADGSSHTKRKSPQTYSRRAVCGESSIVGRSLFAQNLLRSAVAHANDVQPAL